MFQSKYRLTLASILVLVIMGSLPLFTSSITAFADGSPTPEIVFSELNWAGSSISASDEWVELHNTTDRALVLNNYIILGAANKPILFNQDKT